MSNAGDHKPNDFTPVVGAMNLADYTFLITDNINKFPDFCVKEIKGKKRKPRKKAEEKTEEKTECEPEKLEKPEAEETVTQIFVFRGDSLTNRVRDLANEIFMLTYTANEINLTKQPWRKDERLGKQAEAIRLCGDLLAEIQLCKRHFHLTNSKTLHWGKKVRELRKAIEGWHEKDKDRYRNL